MATVTKNAQAMMYFLEEAGKWIGHTRLMKLMYLADLESRKARGYPITSFNYVWHHHGPWDTRFFRARSELLGAELAESREVQHPEYTDRQLRITDRVEHTFTDEDRHILDYVARTYMDAPLSRLLNEVVYVTAPMKSVESRGAALPMRAVDNIDRVKMGGSSIAEMLEAERMAAQGDFMLAREFFDGLLAEAASTDPTADS